MERNITDLLKKYYEGQCTEQEAAWVETWYLNLQTGPLNNSIEELTADLDEVEQQLFEHTTVKRVTLWPRIAAAASIVMFLSIGGYFLLHKQTPQRIAQNEIHNEVFPGGNKAILTLANGKQLSLTDAKNGILLKQGNKSIKKASDGTVSYEANESSGDNQQIGYNTITTPRGGQWSVILPDGSKAMLDAASSIKYPVSFAGNERRVEITGQVYFEIIHNAVSPFRVVSRGQVTEDIGTKFNVNAYYDEPGIKTTLFEGAVKVSNPASTAFMEREGLLLKPGQQAQLQNNKLTVSNANVEEALAWKNGYFSFTDEKMTSVMRKLSRWYDIEIKYQGDVPDQVFDGEIPRNTPLSQVLKVLEEAKVHFTVDGKKLIITP